MADKKISELNSATLPLAGTEVIPIVQGGETKKVAVSGLTPSLQQVTDVNALTTNQITIEDNIITIYDSTTFDEISISPTQITNVDDNSFSTDIKFRTKTQNTDFIFEDEGGEKSIATREWVNENKLSNDIADYTTASLPLSDTDKLLVNQGGTFKEVAKSELVGNLEVENDLYRAWVSYSANNGGGFILDGTSNALTVSGTNAVVGRGGTTIYNSLMMNNYVSGTGAGANAGVKNNNFADGSFLEGFDAYFIFANNDTNVNCQTNIGFYSLTSAIPNLATTDFTTNFVGIGNDVGDVNLSFYCKRTTATASYIKVATNSSFPAHTTTDAYLLRMECNRTLVDADRIIKLTLTNIVSGATISHTFTGVENPTSGSNFTITANRSNRNTGVATNIRVSKIHVTRKLY